MKKFKLVLFSLAIFSVVNIYAGDVLSSYGVGLFYRNADARSLGMGGTQISNFDAYAISRLNPAANTMLKRTTIMLHFFYDGNILSNGIEKASDAYANLDGFQFAVPLSNSMNFRLGLQPWTRMEYHITQNKTLDDQDYIKRFKGEGGINSLDMSFAWAPTPSLSLGITGHYLFGNLKESWWVDYNNTEFTNSVDIYNTKATGITTTLGFTFKVSPSLSFGGIYTPKTTLINKTTYQNVFKVDDNIIEGTTVFPSTLGFGIQYLPKRTWRIAGDYEIQDWKKFKHSTRNVSSMQTVHRISAGTEYLPTLNPLAPYYKRITYRAGIAFMPFFAEDAQGNEINETWLTVGAGLPFFLNLSRIDISLGFGRRGKLSLNGFKEDLIRLGVTITGNERWFLRRY
ncbi:hypothetical protein KAR48_04200 [bacterium]|nr:hypothetical protein [bacterium]